MKTIEFKGIKFVDDTEGRTKSQTENVDSWLYKIMTHYEEYGITKKYFGMELKTDYTFIKYPDKSYQSKELNDKSDVFDFTIKILKFRDTHTQFNVKIKNTHDFWNIRFSFVTLDEAIKFCNILINYECVDILERNKRLFIEK